MSGVLVGRVLREAKTTSPQALLVLVAIAERAGDDGTGGWPSVTTLAREARLSRRQVMRYLADLEGTGDLGIERRAGRANTYHVLPPTGATHGTSATHGTGCMHGTGSGATHGTGVVPPMAPEPYKNRKLNRTHEARAPEGTSDPLVNLAIACRGGRAPSQAFIQQINRWEQRFGTVPLAKAVRDAIDRHDSNPWAAAVGHLAAEQERGTKPNGHARRGYRHPPGTYDAVVISDDDPLPEEQ